MNLTVREAAERAGVSVRTLHYYEEVGLIQPERNEENGYRIYDQELVNRARMIRAYRELQLPLKEIRRLLDASPEERDALLNAQVERLRAQRERIDNRITLIGGIRMMGASRLLELDVRSIDDQMAQARKSTEENPLVQEWMRRSAGWTVEEREALAREQIQLFAAIDTDESIEAFRAWIEAHCYPCSDEILCSFASLFGGDGELGRQVDAVGGEGTARRVRARIEDYLKS